MGVVFPKPAVPLAAQLAKLRARGLEVRNEEEALHYLQHLGYYRLSAYWFPFIDPASPERRFVPGTSFCKLLDHYRFDRELRLLILDAIERVEVSVRSGLNNALSLAHGPHWFMDAGHFDPRFNHARFLSDLRKEFLLDEATGAPKRPHQEVFINHYYQKYGDPILPPSWMVFETLSLGSLSLVFRNLQSRPLRREIASGLGCDESSLRGWLHTLTYVRNLCAHHSRLWNRRLVIKFEVARRHQTLLHSGDSIYGVAVVLADLLRVVAPGSHWAPRLRDLLRRYPCVEPAGMGFPANWTQHPFWEIPSP